MGGKGSGSHQQPTTKVLERRRSAIHAYVHGDMTLDQISRRHGVSREMIRLDCNKEDRTLYLLAVRRRAARLHLDQFVNGRRGKGRRTRLIFTKECVVCGEIFQTVGDLNTKYCSPMHQKIWTMFRYSIDENFRENQKTATARTTLKHRFGDEIQQRYSQRVLDGTATNKGQRWFCRGSLVYHWAIRAFVLGWPLFDMLPDVLQHQIREDLSNNEPIAKLSS